MLFQEAIRQLLQRTGIVLERSRGARQRLPANGGICARARAQGAAFIHYDPFSALTISRPGWRLMKVLSIRSPSRFLRCAQDIGRRWVARAGAFTLQCLTSFAPPCGWLPRHAEPTVNGGQLRRLKTLWLRRRDRRWKSHLMISKTAAPMINLKTSMLSRTQYTEAHKIGMTKSTWTATCRYPGDPGPARQH